MQAADLQTGRLYIALPLPSLIANLNNLTEVLFWLTEVLVRLTEVRVCKSASLQTAFVAHRQNRHVPIHVFVETFIA